MSDLIHGQFHKHGLLYALHCKTINAQQKEKAFLPPQQKDPPSSRTAPSSHTTTLQENHAKPPSVTRQTPRLSLAQVKKAAAYPSAAAARSSLRRPSVTSAPEISQTTEDTSPTADVPPALIRQPEILPRV